MGDHENRDVALYDNFAGDNSSLKFIIKFRKKNFMQLFSAEHSMARQSQSG